MDTVLDRALPVLTRTVKPRLFTSAPTELVERARAGDDRAKEELIQSYQKRVAGYVFNLIGEPSAVDDVCQVVFIKMLRTVSGLREVDRFEPWLFRITRNACMDHLRRKRLRSIFTPLSAVHEEMSAPSTQPMTNELAAVHHALQSLPLRHREVLALCAQERTYEEMAKITGLSLANLKTRLHRARQALKERLNYVRNE